MGRPRWSASLYRGQYFDVVVVRQCGGLPTRPRHDRAVERDRYAAIRGGEPRHDLGEARVVADLVRLPVQGDLHDAAFSKRRGSKRANSGARVPFSRTSATMSAVIGVSKMPLR